MSLGFSSIETLSSTASVDASSLALSGADGWNTSEQSTEIIDLTLDDDFLHVASHGFGLFPAQPSEGKPVLMQDCTRMDSDTSLSSISPSDFNLGSSSFDAPSQEKLKQAFQIIGSLRRRLAYAAFKAQHGLEKETFIAVKQWTEQRFNELPTSVKRKASERARMKYGICLDVHGHPTAFPLPSPTSSDGTISELLPAKRAYNRKSKVGLNLLSGTLSGKVVKKGRPIKDIRSVLPPLQSLPTGAGPIQKKVGQFSNLLQPRNNIHIAAKQEQGSLSLSEMFRQRIVARQSHAANQMAHRVENQKSVLPPIRIPPPDQARNEQAASRHPQIQSTRVQPSNIQRHTSQLQHAAASQFQQPRRMVQQPLPSTFTDTSSSLVQQHRPAGPVDPTQQYQYARHGRAALNHGIYVRSGYSGDVSPQQPCGISSQTHTVASPGHSSGIQFLRSQPPFTARPSLSVQNRNQSGVVSNQQHSQRMQLPVSKSAGVSRPMYLHPTGLTPSPHYRTQPGANMSSSEHHPQQRGLEMPNHLNGSVVGLHHRLLFDPVYTPLFASTQSSPASSDMRNKIPSMLMLSYHSM